MRLLFLIRQTVSNSHSLRLPHPFGVTNKHEGLIPVELSIGRSPDHQTGAGGPRDRRKLSFSRGKNELPEESPNSEGQGAC